MMNGKGALYETMNNMCAYCDSTKGVKLWKETDEMVCLICRLQLLAQEFEEFVSKEDIGMLEYYIKLLE